MMLSIKRLHIRLRDGLLVDNVECRFNFGLVVRRNTLFENDHIIKSFCAVCYDFLLFLLVNYVGLQNKKFLSNFLK